MKVCGLKQFTARLGGATTCLEGPKRDGNLMRLSCTRPGGINEERTPSVMLCLGPSRRSQT